MVRRIFGTKYLWYDVSAVRYLCGMCIAGLQSIFCIRQDTQTTENTWDFSFNVPHIIGYDGYYFTGRERSTDYVPSKSLFHKSLTPVTLTFNTLTFTIQLHNDITP